MIFAKGDRVANIGLGGEDVHRETGGQGGLGRSVGCREPREEHLIGGRRGILGGVLQSELAGQHRSLGVKAEVIEVQMTPVTRAVVHQTDEDLLTDQTLQFDDHRAEVSLSEPEILKKVCPVEESTNSTRVSGHGPPATKKLAHG